MPGYELIGKEEQEAINKIFSESNGVFYRYGFDILRNHIFRVNEFEKNIAEKFNIKYAHATSSGTSALIASLRSLDIGLGDEVITQSHTFIATVEAIVQIGATPVIADIDKSMNMNPDSLSELITDKTKAIIPVHMSGVSCKMDEIKNIIKDDIKIIEDNAQSICGTYKGKYLGTIGDIGIFSFDPGKMLTTGEGGMIVTNNKKIYEKVRAISDHGHAYNQKKPRGEDDILCLGFNYKMNEIQGAIGLEQLKKLDDSVKKHRSNKKILKECLENIDIELREIPNPDGDVGDSVTFLFSDKKKTDKFVNLWKKKGLPTKNLPDAMKWHFALYWNHINFITNKNLSSSKQLLERTVSLPIYYNMDCALYTKNIKNIMKEIL